MSSKIVEQLQSLLPPVSYDPAGAVLTAQMTAEANALQDALSRLEAVEAAIFPETSGAFLGDWERVYGLTPQAGDTYEDRVQAVLVAMGDLGGQSIQYFLSLARRMGFIATVDVIKRAVAGVAVVGDSLPDGDALFNWRLNLPDKAYRTAALEKLVAVRRPANTEVSVGYGETVAKRIQASADEYFNFAQYLLPESKK